MALKSWATPEPPDGMGCRERNNSSSNEFQGSRPSETSYAFVAQRRFPGLVLDFTWEADHEHLSTEKLATFLREDLRLSRDEISRIRKVGGSSRACTVKIETVKDIIVRDRFRSNVEFVRQFKETTWKCTIRGGDKKSKLRFLNVPEGVSDSQLIESLKPFAQPVSGITEERFGMNHDSWLAGIPNGNMQVMVVAKELVPDFVLLGQKKIRVVHRNQAKKCFLCGSEEHLRRNCTGGNSSEASEFNVCNGLDSLHTKRGCDEVEGICDEVVTSLSDYENHEKVEAATMRKPTNVSEFDLDSEEDEDCAENTLKIDPLNDKSAGNGKRFGGKVQARKKNDAPSSTSNGSGIATRSKAKA